LSAGKAILCLTCYKKKINKFVRSDENLLPLMGEGSPILSGSFSDLIKAVLSTKSSNFLYKSGNNKALLDKKSLTTNSKTG
jgi:hypothetical protein